MVERSDRSECEDGADVPGIARESERRRGFGEIHAGAFRTDIAIRHSYASGAVQRRLKTTAIDGTAGRVGVCPVAAASDEKILPVLARRQSPGAARDGVLSGTSCRSLTQTHFRPVTLVIQCDGNAMRAVRFSPHIADHGHAGGAEGRCDVGLRIDVPVGTDQLADITRHGVCDGCRRQGETGGGVCLAGSQRDARCRLAIDARGGLGRDADGLGIDDVAVHGHIDVAQRRGGDDVRHAVDGEVDGELRDGAGDVFRAVGERELPDAHGGHHRHVRQGDFRIEDEHRLRAGDGGEVGVDVVQRACLVVGGILQVVEEAGGVAEADATAILRVGQRQRDRGGLRCGIDGGYRCRSLFRGIADVGVQHPDLVAHLPRCADGAVSVVGHRAAGPDPALRRERRGQRIGLRCRRKPVFVRAGQKGGNRQCEGRHPNDMIHCFHRHVILGVKD